MKDFIAVFVGIAVVFFTLCLILCFAAFMQWFWHQYLRRLYKHTWLHDIIDCLGFYWGVLRRRKYENPNAVARAIWAYEQRLIYRDIKHLCRNILIHHGIPLALQTNNELNNAYVVCETEMLNDIRRSLCDAGWLQIANSEYWNNELNQGPRDPIEAYLKFVRFSQHDVHL